MLNIDFLSRSEITSAFPDEKSCLDHLQKLRWGNDVISPFDKNSKVYICKNNRFRCRNTGKYFNVKTNTLFHNSRISLQKWFIAIWMISNDRKKLTSMFLAKELDLTQKTAWYMMRRIKTYLSADQPITEDKPIVKPIKKKVKSKTITTKPIKAVKTIENEETVPTITQPEETETGKLKMSDWLERLKNKNT